MGFGEFANVCVCLHVCVFFSLVSMFAQMSQDDFPLFSMRKIACFSQTLVFH